MTYQRWINVGYRQELVVHLMNLLIFQTTFFKIGKGKVKQSIATQHTADRSLKNVRDFIVKYFRGVCVLKYKKF